MCCVVKIYSFLCEKQLKFNLSVKFVCVFVGTFDIFTQNFESTRAKIVMQINSDKFSIIFDNSHKIFIDKEPSKIELETNWFDFHSTFSFIFLLCYFFELPTKTFNLNFYIILYCHGVIIFHFLEGWKFLNAIFFEHKIKVASTTDLFFVIFCLYTS